MEVNVFFLKRETISIFQKFEISIMPTSYNKYYCWTSNVNHKTVWNILTIAAS